MSTSAEPTPFLIDPTGQRHLLAGESISIGRAAGNDLVITGKRVSREHARVRRSGLHVLLEDLHSANGTLLNGERLLAATELHDGDEVAVLPPVSGGCERVGRHTGAVRGRW